MYYNRAKCTVENVSDSFELIVRQVGLEQKVLIEDEDEADLMVGALCAIFDEVHGEEGKQKQYIEVKKLFRSDCLPPIDDIKGRRPYHGAAQLIPSVEVRVVPTLLLLTSYKSCRL